MRTRVAAACVVVVVFVGLSRVLLRESQEGPQTVHGAKNNQDIRDFATTHDAMLHFGLPEAAIVEQRSCLDEVPPLNDSDSVTDKPLGSLREEFVEAAPSPQHENVLRPWVKKVFGDKPFELQCRGWICRIKQPDGMPPDSEWIHDIQRHPDGRGLFLEMEFHAQKNREAYLKFDANPINRLLTVVVSAIAAQADGIAECRSAFPYRSTLTFRIVVGRTRRLVVEAVSETRHDREGCVRRRIEDVLSGIAVPSGAAEKPLWTFSVPAN